MKTKFKIGDRVRCVDSHIYNNDSILGKTGTIRVIDDDELPIGVEFDGDITKGNTLRKRLSSNRGW